MGRGREGGRSGHLRCATMTEEERDSVAADLARRLSSMVERHSRRHGGTPVKWLGDGVMFHFPEPGDGVVAALEMVEDSPDLGLPSAHVGLHAGPVLFRKGTTSAAPSTSQPGSPTTPDPGKWWSVRKSRICPLWGLSGSPRSAGSN